MTLHEHPKPEPCAHELKYCAHCDVVFCEKCKREWKQEQFDKYRDLLRKAQESQPRQWPPATFGGPILCATHAKETR